MQTKNKSLAEWWNNIQKEFSEVKEELKNKKEENKAILVFNSISRIALLLFKF